MTTTEKKIDLMAVQFAEKSGKPAQWWRERLTEALADLTAEEGRRPDGESFAEFSKRRGAQKAAEIFAAAEAVAR